jgi:hypothetical protein
VQHGVVRAAPDAGPGPCREPAVSRRHWYVQAERQPAPDTVGDQRWAMAADSVSSGVPCVPPPCGHTPCAGINGFAISHSPSRTIQLAEACGLFVLSGTRSGVKVRSAPLPLPADGRPGSRRGVSPGVLAVRCEGLGPGPIDPSRSTGPPGQAVFSTRRVVAALGAIRASKTVAARAPRRPSGGLRGASYPLSIAATGARPGQHRRAGSQQNIHERRLARPCHRSAGVCSRRLGGLINRYCWVRSLTSQIPAD